MEYRLARGRDGEELEAEVARLIEEGFEPHGSALVRREKEQQPPRSGNWIDVVALYQPMVKR